MPSALRIETPRVFQPLLQPSRHKGVWGGRGSGKSWFFADALVERFLLRPDTRWVCIREIQKSLDQSVKLLIEDRIKALGVGGSFRVLTTHIESGREGRISFQGMQQHTAESIKSLEGYDGAWVAEAQSISQRSLDLLRPTIRKDGSELWFDWNPRRATDPVDVFLRGKEPPPDSIVVAANYRDNPWFPETLRKDMEYDLRRDPDKYAHVWLGDYERHSEARVFKNWRIATPEDDIEPPTGTRFYFGADWGFATDPTVLVRCWIRGRQLILDREVYAVGCEIDRTPALFDQLEAGQARQWPITADSARPETISYMQRHGYPQMQRAKKGAQSVEDGVAFLQSYDILVHPRCQHAIDELTHYAYKTDKLTGDVLPVLADAKNHVIDACRYALEDVRRGSKSGEMSVPWL